MCLVPGKNFYKVDTCKAPEFFSKALKYTLLGKYLSENPRLLIYFKNSMTGIFLSTHILMRNIHSQNIEVNANFQFRCPQDETSTKKKDKF